MANQIGKHKWHLHKTYRNILGVRYGPYYHLKITLPGGDRIQIYLGQKEPDIDLINQRFPYTTENLREKIFDYLK